MLEDNRVRSFIGVSLPGPLVGVLGQLQKEVYERVAGEHRKVNSLPKANLTLPLIDLGTPQEEALEAVNLVLKRIAKQRQPFDLTLGQPESMARDAEPSLVMVPVEDGADELIKLRSQVAAALGRFGFPIREGNFQPHIPISRLKGGDELPSLPTWDEETSLRVDSIVIQVQTILNNGRRKFVLNCEHSLDGQDEVSLAEDELRQRIRQDLERKVQERVGQGRPNLRRKRSRIIDDDLDETDTGDEG